MGGNPPEYNKSVREFDVVTMDRLKVLCVEADYETWKKYAKEKSLHSAILSFLDLKKEFFYHMETTVKGRSYVTARGWEDLSQMIQMYEEEGLAVDENLVGQYLRSDTIVKEFCAYYDIYNKYKKDYHVADILRGNIQEASVEKAKQAGFDERLSLLGLLLDEVQNRIKEVVLTSDYLTAVLPHLRQVKESESPAEALGQRAEQIEREMLKKESANALSKEDKLLYKRELRFLTDTRKEIMQKNMADAGQAFAFVKEAFDGQVAKMKTDVSELSAMLHHMFVFADAAFEKGNEMLILVTELTVNDYSARYIAMFGCEDYHKYNQLLMLSERQSEMKERILELDLDV